MTDTLTPTIRLTEPTPGGDSGTWATLLNSDMAYIDEAINQSITVSIADVNVVLIADGTVSDQARYLRYNFTGALTADRTVTLPANVKVGYASNNTTGGHNVILSTGAGTTVSLADGSWTFFNCDGSNLITQTVQLGGLTVTGTSHLNGSVGGITGLTVASGGISVTTGNVSVISGTLTANGTTSSSQSGFQYGSAGAVSFGPGSVSYSILTPSNMLAANFLANSDVRLKTDLRDLTEADGEAWVMAARPLTFLKEGTREAGFLAQDQVRAGYAQYVGSFDRPGLPELVEGDLVSKADVALNLGYINYIAYLTAALKSALARIAALEALP